MVSNSRSGTCVAQRMRNRKTNEHNQNFHATENVEYMNKDFENIVIFLELMRIIMWLIVSYGCKKLSFLPSGLLRIKNRGKVI